MFTPGRELDATKKRVDVAHRPSSAAYCVASATGDTRLKMTMMCVANVLAEVAGDWPPYCMNNSEIAGNARIQGWC